MPSPPSWYDPAWLFKNGPNYIFSQCLSDNTTFTYYVSPYGCSLCNKVPIPNTDPVASIYVKPSRFNASYLTWDSVSSVPIYYKQQEEYGITVPAPFYDYPAEHPPGTPQEILDTWEHRPGIPCACYGELTIAIVDNFTDVPPPGTKYCMGLGNDFHQPWVQINSYECRRIHVGGTVDPDLKCDLGMSFNALMPDPLGGGSALFLPAPAPNPATPVGNGDGSEITVTGGTTSTVFGQGTTTEASTVATAISNIGGGMTGGAAAGSATTTGLPANPTEVSSGDAGVGTAGTNTAAGGSSATQTGVNQLLANGSVSSGDSEGPNGDATGEHGQRLRTSAGSVGTRAAGATLTAPGTTPTNNIVNNRAFGRTISMKGVLMATGCIVWKLAI
ncbi:hypothetical protein HDV00_001305 [Rhizophlyctis rosea]|nr:hypothetical protein HDV00_001305 [Rhizophlyctis rosea]